MKDTKWYTRHRVRRIWLEWGKIKKLKINTDELRIKKMREDFSATSPFYGLISQNWPLR